MRTITDALEVQMTCIGLTPAEQSRLAHMVPGILASILQDLQTLHGPYTLRELRAGLLDQLAQAGPAEARAVALRLRRHAESGIDPLSTPESRRAAAKVRVVTECS